MSSRDIENKLKKIRQIVESDLPASKGTNRSCIARITKSQTPEPNFDETTLQKYQRELSEERVILEDEYQRYYDNPQQHPRYKKEWSEFWSEKSKQLLKINLDPEKYDFKDEWKETFFDYLKKSQLKMYATIKKELYDKYSRMSRMHKLKTERESRSRVKRDSSGRDYRSRSRDSRTSTDFSRTSPDYRRNRSNNRFSYNKNVKREPSSSDRESPYNKRVKRESSYSFSSSSNDNQRIKQEPSYDYNRHARVKQERVSRSPTPRNQRPISNDPSVITVCRDLLSLDRRLKLHRNSISELLTDAENFEKERNREYLMTQADYEFLFRTRRFIVNSMDLQWLNNSMATKLRMALYKLIALIRRWEKYMKMQGKLHDAIEIREENERKAWKWQQNKRTMNNYRKNENPRIGNRRRRSTSQESRKLSRDSNTSDYKSMEKSSSSKEHSPKELDFHSTLINIKKEKIEAEQSKLSEEREKLLQQIKQEFNEPLANAMSWESEESADDKNLSDKKDEMTAEATSTFDDVKLSDKKDDIDSLTSFAEATPTIGDTKLLAAEIGDKELIGIFKAFESASEAEVEFLRVKMEEIEANDPERFKRLEKEMEEIQNLYENENLLDGLTTDEAAEIFESIAKDVEEEEERVNENSDSDEW